MNKIIIYLFFIIISFLLLTACAPREEIPVSYIFASHCSTCTEAEKRMDSLAENYRKAGGKDELIPELYNVLIPRYYDPAMELIDSRNIPPSARNLPLLLVGEEQWFYGEDDIESALGSLEAGRLP